MRFVSRENARTQFCEPLDRNEDTLRQIRLRPVAEIVLAEVEQMVFASFSCFLLFLFHFLLLLFLFLTLFLAVPKHLWHEHPEP